MIKRTLLLTDPVHLSIENHQLKVKKTESNETKIFPLEDFGFVVVENLRSSFSSSAILRANQNGTIIVQCDENHMPFSFITPIEENTLQQERVVLQVGLSETHKNRIWQQLIRAKIVNQTIAIEKLGGKIARLERLSKLVKVGDSDNTEAQAAKYYWDQMRNLLETDFKRGRFNGGFNILLNYGYSILRAIVARAIIGAGLLPMLGIHHHNRYNSFCLADDLMEPYRPFVDVLAFQVNKQFPISNDNITKDHKIELLKIVDCDVRISGHRSPLQLAADTTAISLLRFMEETTKSLELPQLN